MSNYIFSPMKNTILLLTFLLAATSYGQNIVSNGSFERDFTGWDNIQGENESSSRFIIERINTHSGKAMKVVVLRVGANDWDIQSVIKAPIKKRKTYRLEFYGRTRTPGAAIRAVIQNEEYIAKDFNLTTEWTKYTWEFKPNEHLEDFKFHFFNTGTFYIDEVSIERI